MATPNLSIPTVNYGNGMYVSAGNAPIVPFGHYQNQMLSNSNFYQTQMNPQYGYNFQNQNYSQANKYNSLSIPQVGHMQGSAFSGIDMRRQPQILNTGVNMRQLYASHIANTAPPQEVAASMLNISQQDNGNQDNLDEFEDTACEQAFSEYIPKKSTKGQPHPDILVESPSLSAVDPPEISYTLKIPDEA